MARRSGGATRTQVLELTATSPEPPELDKALATKADGVERGTPFDVTNLRSTPWVQLFDDEGLVTTMPERQWIADVERMLTSGGQPAAVEKALTLPIRSANLTIEKPDKDIGQTEFVREVLYSGGQNDGMCPDIVAIVSQIAHSIVVKKTYHELVFDTRKDGRTGYSSIQWRPPQTCEPIRDRGNGDLRGFRQYIDWQVALEMSKQRDIIRIGSVDNVDQDYGYVRIPAARAVVHVHGQHRDPINGYSDLAVTHWAWSLQQKILLMWATFLDGTSLPKVIVYGADPGEATRNATTIASLRGSGVVGMVRDGTVDPAAKVFEVLETSGAGAAQFHEMIQFLEQQMSKSVMAGFLDLTSGATRGIGSYALSADQSGLFLTSRQAAAKEIGRTVTEQIIAPLVRINFGSEAAVPRLVFEQMGHEQSTLAMQMLQQLGSAQNTSVPPGFLDLLIERVAQFLDLPDDKVEKVLADQAEFRKKQAEMMGRPPEQSDTPQGKLTDNVNAAGDMVAAKQNGRPINREQLRAQGASPAQEQLKADRQQPQ